jgi:hypothetical protein
VGQPVAGAAAGQIITRTLQAGHDAFFARHLAPDERRRADYLYREARRQIWERMACGEQPAEWVRSAIAGDRLASVEVLEHGLQQARDQFEERKLRHLAALLAYVLYYHEFTAADAHRFLELGGRLSYRQLLLLSIFSDDEARVKLPDRRLGGSVFWGQMAIALEIQELAAERAIVSDEGVFLSAYDQVNLARTRSLLLGSVLDMGMALQSADARDRPSVISDLNRMWPVLPRNDPPSS